MLHEAFHVVARIGWIRDKHVVLWIQGRILPYLVAVLFDIDDIWKTQRGQVLLDTAVAIVGVVDRQVVVGCWLVQYNATAASIGL